MGDRGVTITIPHGYSKNSLPNKTRTEVNVGMIFNNYKIATDQGFLDVDNVTDISGIDIKDIPNVNDRDFSVTLNGFFLVRWRDPRLIIANVVFGENEPLIPVDVSLVTKFPFTVVFSNFPCQYHIIVFAIRFNSNIY